MPKYPENWKQRSLAVRSAANWQCQHCKRQCRQPRESLADFVNRTGYDKSAVEAHPRRWSLQTAHLNHDPENAAAELVALCVPCHRHYDNSQMAKIKSLERERHGQLSVNQQLPKPLEGLQLPIAGLAEPCGVLNQPTSNPVTPGTLVAWIENRLQLLPTVAERTRYMETLKASNPENEQALAALCKTIPYRYAQASLSIAIGHVQENLVASRERHHPDGQKRRGRHRLKGQASGFIEQREGNKTRSVPSVSYYYRWDSSLGRVTEYIPVSKLRLIERLIKERTPAIEVLGSVCAGKKKTTQRAKDLLQHARKEPAQIQLLS